VDSILKTSSIIKRFGLPAIDALVASMENWREELPQMDIRHLLDFAYLEHRDGAWYGAQFCCDPTLLRLGPLLTFRSVELMIQLPPDWKLSGRLGSAIVDRLWPDLNLYPYNSLGSLQDVWIKIQRAALDPRILLKKIRKMQG
jgi:hypothetical protein